MFKKLKCPRCESKVSKGFEFCPYCGLNLIGKEREDYGFLGKNDLDIQLPRGFNMLLKPLMKELNKQMVELDREIKKEADKNPNKNVKTSFSITFGTPGQKPIRIENFGMPQHQQQVTAKKKNALNLPKISPGKLNKAKKFKRSEPLTDVEG